MTKTANTNPENISANKSIPKTESKKEKPAKQIKSDTQIAVESFAAGTGDFFFNVKANQKTAGKAVKNFGKGIVNVVKGAGECVLHPIDTAYQIKEGIEDYGSAAGYASNGDMNEASKHFKNSSQKLGFGSLQKLGEATADACTVGLNNVNYDEVAEAFGELEGITALAKGGKAAPGIKAQIAKLKGKSSAPVEPVPAPKPSVGKKSPSPSQPQPEPVPQPAPEVPVPAREMPVAEPGIPEISGKATNVNLSGVPRNCPGKNYMRNKSNKSGSKSYKPQTPSAKIPEFLEIQTGKKPRLNIVDTKVNIRPEHPETPVDARTIGTPEPETPLTVKNNVVEASTPKIVNTFTETATKVSDPVIPEPAKVIEYELNGRTYRYKPVYDTGNHGSVDITG